MIKLVHKYSHLEVQSPRGLGKEEAMNITVYLGASFGTDPALKAAVKELGTWIAESGNRLVYGGSDEGLMGVLADSVMDAGGPVTGVETQFFIDEGVGHDHLTELIVTDGMPARKCKMKELGDAFIAFPGGTGTLEEISEVLSDSALKFLTAPCIIYNLNGYYDALKELLHHMLEMGMSTEEKQRNVHFASNLEEIKKIIGRI